MLANANKPANSHAPRERMTGEQRHEAIINAAIRVFSERGFNGTTTRQLAAAAGITEPVLYRHFATKSDLYSAIIDRLTERLFHSAEADLCAAAAVNDDHAFFTRLAQAVYFFHAQEPEAARLLLFSALESHELILLWRERVINPGFEAIHSYIEGRVAAGAFRNVDATAVARMFLGSVAHYFQCTQIYGCTPGPFAPQEYINQVVTVFLNGIREGRPVPPATAEPGSNR